MRKESKDFCCVDNYSVIIPYKVMVKFIEAANKIDEMNFQLKEMSRRYDAMQLMYREMLDKLEYINRYM